VALAASAFRACAMALFWASNADSLADFAGPRLLAFEDDVDRDDVDLDDLDESEDDDRSRRLSRDRSRRLRLESRDRFRRLLFLLLGDRDLDLERRRRLVLSRLRLRLRLLSRDRLRLLLRDEELLFFDFLDFFDFDGERDRLLDTDLSRRPMMGPVPTVSTLSNSQGLTILEILK